MIAPWGASLPTHWWPLLLTVAHFHAKSRCCHIILPTQSSGKSLGASGHPYVVPAVDGVQHMAGCARNLGRFPRALHCPSSSDSLIECGEVRFCPVALLSGWRSCCASSRPWRFLETWCLLMFRASPCHLPSWLQEQGVT